MNKKLRFLLLIVIAVVLGLNIYRWNAKNLLRNELPMPFCYGTAIVLSGSMEPRLSVDDLVIIRQTDSVAVDDIIVFQQDGSLVIHRVIAVDGDTVLTQGDANTVPDEPITMEDVKGIMVLSVPRVGAAVRFFRHPVTLTLTVTAALILTERSFSKDKRQNKKELSELENEIEQLKSKMKDDWK